MGVQEVGSVCPECGGTVITDDHEARCQECGLVVDAEAIDRGPEWRWFDSEDRERTGAPLTPARHDRGLSTEIGRSRGGPSRRRRRMARLRRHHRRAQVDSKADRNRRNAFLEIRRISGQLSLPDCFRDRACKLFAEAQSADLLRGRSLEGFAAAAVYVVCRTGNVARTTAEIVSIARASEAELSAAYDAINRELDVRTGPIDPKQYLARFASRLDVSRAVERRAEDLVDRSREEGLTTGRNPGGVAGGCLYTAAREQNADLTQRAVADVADVAPVTIRETYHALRED